MKKTPTLILALVILFCGAFDMAQATTILFPGGGGTGWGFPGGLQAHTVLIGEGTNPIATATPATAGWVLTSNGVSTDPTFQPSSGGSGGSGTVSTSTHETAGSVAYWTSNSATPALLGQTATSSTGTATDIVAYNASGGDTFTGGVTAGGLAITGVTSNSLSNLGVIEYLNPNLRFSLPSTESYSFYNQGRGTNLLMNLNGSTGQLRLGQYGGGTITGTPAHDLEEDSSGNVIETALPSSFAYPFTPSTDGTLTTSATSTVLEDTAPLVGFDVPNGGAYGIGGSVFAYSSTTNFDTILGQNAGGQGATTSATATFETAIGNGALGADTSTGLNNVAVGYQALNINTTGSQNTAVGVQALPVTVGGSGNTGLGYKAGVKVSSGQNNTCVGELCLQGVSTQSGNTALGFQAGFDGTGGNNIVIGQHVDAAVNGNSGQLNIGNAIFGTSLYAGASQSAVPVNAFIGISSSSPYANLSVMAGGNYASLAPSTVFAIGSSTQGNSTSTLFAVLSSGNVGIGTTSPWGSLSVQPTVGGGVPSVPSFVVGSSTAGTSDLVVDQNGNVVFGANAPDTVNGIVASPDFISNTGGDGVVEFRNQAPGKAIYSYLSANSDYSQFRIKTTDASWIVGNIGDASLRVWDDTGSGVTDILINKGLIGQTLTLFDSANNTGYVGIGSSTPYANLSVMDGGTYLSQAAGTAFAIGSSTAGTATSTLMSVQSTGSVTFGKLGTGAGNGAGCLSSAGVLTFDSGANCITSTPLAKYDIHPISDTQANEVLRLQPVQYNYYSDGSQHYGFIADAATQAIDPSLVVLAAEDTQVVGAGGKLVTVKKGQPLSFDYARYTGLLTSQVQLQEKQIQALGGGKPMRSAEENWQWGAIGLLALAFLSQQVQINKLKRG